MNWQETLGDLMDKLTGWLEALVLHLPNLLMALLIFLLAWIAANLVGKGLGKLLKRTPAPKQIRTLIVRFVTFAVLAAGLFIALGVLELDKTVTSLLAGAGILGLALGFAFQDIAANFMAGIYLAFARPIRVGDVIETQDHFGVVERVDLRSLALRKTDGPMVLIPNKLVFENPLINYSITGSRRVDLAVGVAYGDDLPRVQEVAREAVEAIEERNRDRDVEVFFTAFGASSIDLVVRFWIPYARQVQFMAAQSEAIVRVKAAFDEAGITIPFPIRTLDFGVVGGLPLAEALPERLLEDRTEPPRD